MEKLESEAALILREVTGMREVAGGRLPYTGDVMILARGELCGISLLLLRWSGRWGLEEYTPGARTNWLSLCSGGNIGFGLCIGELSEAVLRLGFIMP